MNEEPDVYVSEVDGGGPHSGAVVSTTPIKAGDLTGDHVGRTLGFHDDQTQRNVPGEILRVEHHYGPPPSVSVWRRCLTVQGRVTTTCVLRPTSSCSWSRC